MTDRGLYRRYVDRKFSDENLRLIQQANSIISEYEAQDLVLTLRQLYYQHVARGFIENTPRSYDRLGALISDGRMAGLISWTAIEDRGRNLMGLRTQISPAAAVKDVLDGYRIDKWVDQPFRPEVWVEKHALEGVVGSICDDLQVNFFAVGGYNSQSAQWRAGRRMADYVAKGQRPIVFHLGDHDPSGIDMTRDNRERLSLFAGVPVQVVRLALNRSQVNALRPPPNPAKVTDSRFETYQREHGDESWELDALDPAYIKGLIRGAVDRVRDESLWEAALAVEQADRERLADVVEDVADATTVNEGE